MAHPYHIATRAAVVALKNTKQAEAYEKLDAPGPEWLRKRRAKKFAVSRHEEIALLKEAIAALDHPAADVPDWWESRSTWSKKDLAYLLVAYFRASMPLINPSA